jgi:hypothetical protein
MQETNLPSRSWKYVFVTLIPTTLYNLACVGLILFFGGISKQPDVVVNVKIE